MLLVFPRRLDRFLLAAGAIPRAHRFVPLARQLRIALHNARPQIDRQAHLGEPAAHPFDHALGAGFGNFHFGRELFGRASANGDFAIDRPFLLAGNLFVQRFHNAGKRFAVLLGHVCSSLKYEMHR